MPRKTLTCWKTDGGIIPNVQCPHSGIVLSPRRDARPRPARDGRPPVMTGRETESGNFHRFKNANFLPFNRAKNSCPFPRNVPSCHT